MIVRLEENPKQVELEVLIKYAQMNETVHQLITTIKSLDTWIQGSDEDKLVRIKVSDIYYIESVDKRTFIYCEKTVFRSESKLYQLIDSLSDFGFVQISKSCLLNISVLEHIRPLLNSKLEATLTNGEKVIISRKYVPAIRKQISGGVL